MDNDDVLVGRLLSRREAVKLLGIGGAAAFGGMTLEARDQDTPPLASSCVVRPEMTEGPFFVDAALARSDIRANSATGVKRDGVALGLTFNVSQIVSGRCAPLSGAVVHIWQCDALGVYSGVTDRRARTEAATEDFLRGVQTTDAQGRAQFTTIYPGWYRGRAVHIHFKIRTQVSGSAYEYTSQLFVPETLTDEIHARPPYAANGRRDTTNERDGIYRGGGDQLLLRPAPAGDGYQTAMDITLDLSDATVGRSDAEGRGRGRGRGRGSV